MGKTLVGKEESVESIRFSPFLTPFLQPFEDSEAVVQRCSVKKVFSKISCEFCEIFKNTYFYRTPMVAASKAYIFSIVEAAVRRCSENMQQIYRTPIRKICSKFTGEHPYRSVIS